jgi:hypothetical protein
MVYIFLDIPFYCCTYSGSVQGMAPMGQKNCGHPSLHHVDGGGFVMLDLES